MFACKASLLGQHCCPAKTKLCQWPAARKAWRQGRQGLGTPRLPSPPHTQGLGGVGSTPSLPSWLVEEMHSLRGDSKSESDNPPGGLFSGPAGPVPAPAGPGVTVSAAPPPTWHCWHSLGWAPGKGALMVELQTVTCACSCGGTWK